jgi:hypothetical protein
LAADDELGPLGGIKIGGGRASDRPPIVAEYSRPRHRRSGGWFSKLVLAAILIAAGGFFLAPWFALQAVRSAAESRDSQALDDLVDYNAVRAGLSAQMSGAPAPAPIDPWQHPLQAMRQALQASPMVSAPRVESYLTPDALNAELNGRAPGQPVSAHPWPNLRYWGFDRCRLAVVDPADPRRETLLTFQRRGWYTWKLSQIRLAGS